MDTYKHPQLLGGYEEIKRTCQNRNTMNSFLWLLEIFLEMYTWDLNCTVSDALQYLAWRPHYPPPPTLENGLRKCEAAISFIVELTSWNEHKTYPGILLFSVATRMRTHRTSEPFIPHNIPILPPCECGCQGMHQKYSITCNIIRCVTLCC